MRLTYLLLILILWSCGQSEKSSNKKVVEKPTTEIKKEVESQKKPKDNSKTATQREIPEGIVIPNDSIFKLLISKFGDAPFYCQPKEKTFYVVSNQEYDYRGRFNRQFKYGISDDSLNTLLPVDFDKIYNPDLVIKNCFEIKKNGKVGLYNYVTSQILFPRFDYIIPEDPKISNIAFGKVADKWFKIDNSDLTRFPMVNYNPKDILSQLKFNVHDLGNNMLYNSYYVAGTYNEPTEGQGVVITPSYLEYFKIMSDAFEDIVISDERGEYDFGIEKAKLRTSYLHSISENITAFFYSFYEEGIDARDYTTNTESIVIYNTQNSQSTTIDTENNSGYYYPCNDDGTRFVNDSILEIKSIVSPNNDLDKIEYDFETQFRYYQIDANGSVKELKSNRHFDFTKFIYINEQQFEGCFGKHIPYDEQQDDYNILISEHLSIEDLDIMRNEIFAEYGYKFKTEEWQDYFSKKGWYKPRFDDVNDQLTEIDKANIKVILKVKEEMLKDEQKFTQKERIRYYAPG